MKRVFLVGCPRSGTTLLQSMIASNPQVFTLPETSFFLKLYGDYAQRFYGLASKRGMNAAKERYRRLRNGLGIANKTPTLVLSNIYRDLGKPVPQHLRRPRRWRLQEAVDAFSNTMDHFAIENSCECWLEKTPGHFAYVDEIKKRVKHAYFIHLVRSPLENIASLRDAATRFPDTEAWKPFGDLEVCMDVWGRSTNVAIEHAEQPRHLIVDYDDIVAHPEATVVKIEKFLTLKKSHARDRETQRRHVAKKMVKNNEKWKSGVFSNLKRISKVEASLDRDEIQLIQETLSTYWERFQVIRPTFRVVD